MQFGGIPMVPSPSSTGITSPTSVVPISAPVSSVGDSGNQYQFNHNNGRTTSSMFAPHPNPVNHHTNSMFQSNVNGQMSNGSAANGNHYVPNNHQQQAQSPQQQQMNNGSGSNGSSPNGGNSAQLIYPALHLQPLNDTFAPKQICLSPPGPQNKIKIGRQTNNKTIPQPSNGFFDSKVLSRMHAEVWSQDGKVYIKDVKSSNGTFINGSRLSPEGQESDTFEVHTDDVVEFGIDIVGEDNKTIIHHKVACRAFLVMTAEEALGLRQDFAALYRGGIAGSTLNHHAVGPGAEGGLRRSKMGANGAGGFGGAGNGSTMMSFDHILHKLQAELQKSRDTAGELGTLNTAMNDIGETLGGGLPPMQNPPYQHMVPSMNGERDGQGQGEQGSADGTKAAASETLIKALEEQIRETQRALNSNVERLAGLEARWEEHEEVKSDVGVMRKQVEEARRELAEAVRLRSLASRDLMANGRGVEVMGRHGGEEGDFDDGASMASVDTVVPGSEGAALGNGPMGVDEVESADVAKAMPMGEEESLDDAEALQRFKNHIGPAAPPDGVPTPFGKEVDESESQKSEELSKRLETIERQLERALELGKTLAGQHAQAAETVKRLEERVKSLESEQTVVAPSTASPSKEGDEVLHEVGAAVGGGALASGSILAILEAKWGKWRDAFENDFEMERMNLREEREEVRRVVKMWDSLNSDIEEVCESETSGNGGEDGGESQTSEVRSSQIKQRSTAAKKRKRRRAAAAAAAAAATASSSSPPMSSVGLSASSSAQTNHDATARINRELRSLLYTDNYNLLVKEGHLGVQGADALHSNTTHTHPDGTSPPSDVGSSEARDDGGEGSSDRRRQRQAHMDAKGSPLDGVVRGGDVGPTSLPVLGMAGVVVFGMTAWVLAGGKGINLGGATGG